MLTARVDRELLAAFDAVAEGREGEARSSAPSSSSH